LYCSALSFLLVEGAWDRVRSPSVDDELVLILLQAFEWTSLSAADRATIKAQYAAAGIKLIVSAFGSSDVPTSSGVDPVAMVRFTDKCYPHAILITLVQANTMGNWVIQYGLDGMAVHTRRVPC
jgi:hypothetical protein